MPGGHYIEYEKCLEKMGVPFHAPENNKKYLYLT